MSILSVRTVVAIAALLATTATIEIPAQAAQNPITAAREAFRKAQEDAKRKAQEEAQRRTGQVPVPGQPAPAATQPGAQAPGAPSVRQTGDVPAAAASAQETARLAAALSFIDVAGLKLGSPLAEAEKVLRGINPKFTLKPTFTTVWPIDRANTAAQPPPNAPKSVNLLTATFVEGNNSESFMLQGTLHPNPAVVIKIERGINYAEGTGPGYDVLVDGLRKKYGPESGIETANQQNNAFGKTFPARWFFDERGQVLRGNLANQIFGTCTAGHPNTPTGLCGTLTVLNVHIDAGGSGIVRSLRVEVSSSPLLYSAQETTNAYLRQVDEERAKQQQKESSQRPTPKL